jgi:hypothetical protein
MALSVRAEPEQGWERQWAARLILSDRWEDVAEALGVVHDGFVQAGYMPRMPSGRRMILPYLAERTAFFVARRGERAVGAAALIPDSVFGLPADRGFVEEIDALRAEGRPILECGSLVVAAAWRRQSALIVAQLMAGAARVLAEQPDARVVVSVAPSAERFYGTLFGFRRIAEPRPLFGPPALLLETDNARVQENVSRGGTAPQRLLAELMDPARPHWLEDRRGGEPWPTGPVTELLAEQGCLEPLFGQLGALSRRLGWWPMPAPALAADGAPIASVGRG